MSSEQFAPKHFAPEGYAVLCGGLELRHHEGAFVSPEAAESWAENAHCCPARHVAVPVATLRGLQAKEGE